MHRCPQCGYKDRPDWPVGLCVIAFYALYMVWMLGDYQPRELRWIGLGAFLLFTLGGLRLAIRYKSPDPREREDAEKSSDGQWNSR